MRFSQAWLRWPSQLQPKQTDKVSTIDMETIISRFYHIIQKIATHSAIHLVRCCHGQMSLIAVSYPVTFIHAFSLDCNTRRHAQNLPPLPNHPFFHYCAFNHSALTSCTWAGKSALAQRAWAGHRWFRISSTILLAHKFSLITRARTFTTATRTQINFIAVCI